MKRTGNATTLLVLIMLLWAAAARAEEGDWGDEDGPGGEAAATEEDAAAEKNALEATVTDAFGFEMKFKGLAFKVKTARGEDAAELTLDHVPLVGEGETVNLWLAQIERAECSEQNGRVSVRATIQGERDEVTGWVRNPARCAFEGTIAEGPRKGQAARIPLTEVKVLVVTTPYDRPVVQEAGDSAGMPGPKDDVLWVSSVPEGAEVWAKAEKPGQNREWREYKLIGRTPVVAKVPPGPYKVRVAVPAELVKNIPRARQIDEDTNPFERDGWSDVVFREPGNVVASMVYDVNKNDGSPATLIALFQRKDATMEEVLKTFPSGHRFTFLDRKLEGVLLNRRVPRADVPVIIEALHRGGKIIWHGERRSLMIELVPGERGWIFRSAMRPKK